MSWLIPPDHICSVLSGLTLVTGCVFFVYLLKQRKTEPERSIIWVLKVAAMAFTGLILAWFLFLSITGGAVESVALQLVLAFLTVYFMNLALLKWQTSAVTRIRARLNELVEHSTHGLAIVDRTGRIRRVNRRMLEILGVDAGVMSDNVLRATDLGLDSVIAAAHSGGEGAVRMDLNKLPGRTLPVMRAGVVYLVVNVRIENNYFGRGSRFVEVDDVTEREHTLDLLRESRCRMEMVMQAAEASGYACEGTTVTSDGWFRSLGYPFSAIEMQELAKYIHPQDKHKIPTERMVMPQTTGSMYSFEARFRHISGNYIWYYITSRTAELNGEQVILGMALNIDRHKRMEQYMHQNDRLVAVGQLAGGVAHDINNHLCTIQTSVRMLNSSTDELYRRKYTDWAYEAIANSSGILKSLLSFSKGEEGGSGSVEMESLVMQTLDMLQRALPRGVRLTGSVDGCGVVTGSFYELQNVILNVGLNARDALPTHGGEITVRGWTGPWNGLMPDKKSGWYFISIKDNGSGMSAETQKKAFDPYFTTKEKGKGTGLGLFTSFGCVQRHGGTLSLESAEGMGTEFVIALPLAEPPAVNNSQAAMEFSE